MNKKVKKILKEIKKKKESQHPKYVWVIDGAYLSETGFRSKFLKDAFLFDYKTASIIIKSFQKVKRNGGDLGRNEIIKYNDAMIKDIIE